ncbi:MAG: 16S rRNA (guanine(966)-N(2))-methyltransferase RsmD [Pseudanabaenaceae cyanobacterium SKYGB_i_bin29]|nr:16S rRNA (guanine(966)-N(2))-methyltransferase RsmD [Pseudanabaenaceae cyanobacterium SKYG29]MDW8421485.1 16S rRNA (guanine(966)-N(2))-methyltransferase RsmD [Pseudanabaenaceae cyanobacterium SKYGB_i_bin29]
MNLRIGGDRKLKTPKTIRPTSSKVRSALFNIWQHHLGGATWLELCAGSGAMSAEALRRGAKQVVAIEMDAAACKIIQANLAKISQPQQFHILKMDVVKAIAKLQGSFDLIYFDPPYDSNLYLPVLTHLHRLCHAATQIAVEHSSYHPLPETVGELVQTDRRSYGQTCLSFFALATGVPAPHPSPPPLGLAPFPQIPPTQSDSI